MFLLSLLAVTIIGGGYLGADAAISVTGHGAVTVSTTTTTININATAGVAIRGATIAGQICAIDTATLSAACPSTTVLIVQEVNQNNVPIGQAFGSEALSMTIQNVGGVSITPTVSIVLENSNTVDVVPFPSNPITISPGQLQTYVFTIIAVSGGTNTYNVTITT